MKCNRCGTLLLSNKARCNSCRYWNVLGSEFNASEIDDSILLSDANIKTIDRIPTKLCDKCLGGGLVRTSTVLLGGAPGAGKSTLSLQIADILAGDATEAKELMYIATEEAIPEIQSRAMRLQLPNIRSIRIKPNGMNLGTVLLKRRPLAVIIDSLPGMFGDDHSAAVLACKEFKKYAEELNAPILIIDHVTKADDFAGLMALQHEVSALLTLFPNNDGTRTLKTIKNRFGPSHVETHFMMTELGLEAIPEKEI